MRVHFELANGDNFLVTLKKNSLATKFINKEADQNCFYLSEDDSELAALSVCNNQMKGYFTRNSINYHVQYNELLKQHFVREEVLKEAIYLDNDGVEAEIEEPVSVYGLGVGLEQRRRIELVIVNDFMLFRDYFSSDARKVKQFNQELVNVMNKIYGQVNMEIALKYSEVWSGGDKITATDFKNLLPKFTDWARDNLKKQMPKYDSAHLITGKKAYGGLGLGYFATVCGEGSFSTAVNQFAVNAGQPRHTTMYFAHVLAHELGHNLGLNHADGPGMVCKCGTVSGRCAMMGSAYYEANMWTDCSLNELAKRAKEGKYPCLE